MSFFVLFYSRVSLFIYVFNSVSSSFFRFLSIFFYFIFLHREAAEEPGAGRALVATAVLGRSLTIIAPPLAKLSDFEEMVLALVHPLVQVYTIPSTGELAYVGHVCNFRQHVSHFLSSLPTLPQDMPFVLVRPRRAPHQQDRRPRARKRTLSDL